MLRRIYAALMIVLTMFGGTYAPQQTAPNPSDTSNETAKQASFQASDNPLATLSQSEAEEIALKSLGITRSNVRMDRTELDWEKGQAIWEVEIYYGNTEYDFEINALTGEILRTDVEPTERPDTDVVITPTPILPNDPSTDTSELTKEQALAIALEHAGLIASEVKRLKVEKDYEKGTLIYEIEIEKGAWEYEYEIRVSDGKILEWDKEIDD